MRLAQFNLLRDAVKCLIRSPISVAHKQSTNASCCNISGCVKTSGLHSFSRIIPKQCVRESHSQAGKQGGGRKWRNALITVQAVCVGGYLVVHHMTNAKEPGAQWQEDQQDLDAADIPTVLYMKHVKQSVTGTDSVIDLHPKNFQSTVDAAPTLVAFYAPWCGHCKKMRPAFAKAAAAVESLDLGQMAAVDATQHTVLAERYKIRGYPTFKFFKDGEVEEYKGGRSYKDFLAFMKRKAQEED